MRRVPPHPYPLPKERETHCLSRSQSGIDLMRTRGGSPSAWGLLGERVGVRGNVIDARNEPHKMQASATHRKCRGTSFFKRCLAIFCAVLMVSIGGGRSATAEKHAAPGRSLLYVEIG